jgi:hypothetical protein
MDRSRRSDESANMSAARKTTQDWEEKTAFDTRPATQFAATVSGERDAISAQDLEDLFGGEEEAELEATRVRDVDSVLLKAAAEDVQPPTVPTPVLASKSALPETPAVAFEPAGPVSMTRPTTARWRTPEVAIAGVFFVLAAVTAMLVVYYSRG